MFVKSSVCKKQQVSDYMWHMQISLASTTIEVQRFLPFYRRYSCVHYSFWCPWKRVVVAILDQFQSFSPFAGHAGKYIPSHITDVYKHQKLKHFLIVQKEDIIQVNFQNSLVLIYHLRTFTQLRLNRSCFKPCWLMQIAVHANGCVIFLEIILSSAEFSKILVSQNSEFETELMEKFTIKIILVNFFSVLRQTMKACFLVTCVGSFLFYNLELNLWLYRRNRPWTVQQGKLKSIHSWYTFDVSFCTLASMSFCLLACHLAQSNNALFHRTQCFVSPMWWKQKENFN